MFYRIKSGKVVILLSGRYAGRKAVVMNACDEGTGDKKFSHAIGKLFINALFIVNVYLRIFL